MIVILTPDKALWQTFGEEETGAKVFTTSEMEQSTVQAEIGRSGIESDTAITIAISPILTRGSRSTLGSKPLPAGKYTLTILTAEPTANANGQRVMELTQGKAGQTVPYKFKKVSSRYIRINCSGNSENDWNSISEFNTSTLTKKAESSHAYNEHAASLAVDGDDETRGDYSQSGSNSRKRVWIPRRTCMTTNLGLSAWMASMAAFKESTSAMDFPLTEVMCMW